MFPASAFISQPEIDRNSYSKQRNDGQYQKREKHDAGDEEPGDQYSRYELHYPVVLRHSVPFSGWFLLKGTIQAQISKAITAAGGRARVGTVCPCRCRLNDKNCRIIHVWSCEQGTTFRK
jgi:hypothetical protein